MGSSHSIKALKYKWLLEAKGLTPYSNFGVIVNGKCKIDSPVANINCKNDQLIWVLTTSGLFTSKSTYKSISISYNE